MNEIIYLESDDDIASVIGRIKEVESDGISLMIPRGGTIGQSIVNLKLLKREIEKQNKIISLITSDKISRNLALQVGITVHSSVNEAKAAKPVRPKPVEGEDMAGEEIIEAASAEDLAAAGDFKVNRYDKDEENGLDEGGAVDNKEDEIINPAHPEALQPEVTAVVEPDRSVPTEPPKGTPETIVTSNAGLRDGGNHVFAKPSFGPKKVGSRKKPLLILISSFVLIALVLSYILLPSATASIKLASTDYEKSYEFSIDKSVKEVNSTDIILPGEVSDTQGDLSKEFSTTGTKDEGTKAGGNITFYNQYDSNPQAIAGGSLLSASGKQFLTVGAVTVPGATLSGGNIVAGQVAGKVIAKESGDSYNITPAKFTIESFSGEKRMKIFGQTSAALSGGTTKTVKIISADDLKKATDSLTADLTTTLTDQIQAELTKSSKKFLTSTISSEQIAFEPSGKEGDEAEKFSAKLTLKISGISFVESALRQVLTEKVQKEIGDKMIINPDTSSVTFDVGTYDKEKGIVKMTAKYSGKTGNKVSADLIKNNIKYKKYGTAKDYIENIDGVSGVELNTWPSFLARTPLIAGRITITFGYQD